MAAALRLADERHRGEGKVGRLRKRQLSPDAAAEEAKLPNGFKEDSSEQEAGVRRCALLSPAALSMLLLALQFGLQPVLSRSCVPKEAPKTAVVWATEAVKIVLCLIFLATEDRKTRAKVWKTWSLRESLRLAAFPAVCYAVQNVLAQVGYQHLDSLSFNLLNQTKTIAAAVCLFVLLGKQQSPLQLLALAMLLAASVILNYPSGSSAPLSPNSVTMGVLPVLGASFLSGLSAALTQSALQGQKRNSYLLSMELAVYGQVFLIASLASKELPSLLGYLIGTKGPTPLIPPAHAFSGLFEGWTAWTLIPVATNAAGGIVVGLVTKYAGGVAKGFSLIGGILITAFVQAIMQSQVPPPLHWAAAALVGVSTYLHAKYPPKPRSKSKKSV